jgi:hypothetical protein
MSKERIEVIIPIIEQKIADVEQRIPRLEAELADERNYLNLLRRDLYRALEAQEDGEEYLP